jgi:signal transduction histidine kinase
MHMVDHPSRAVRKIRSVARAILARATMCICALQRAVGASNSKRDKRAYLLDIILSISIIGLSVIEIVDMLGQQRGCRPFIAIIALYIFLYICSRKGYVRATSIALIVCEAIGTMIIGWIWGASLPETLLLAVLVIETASVLLGSTAGFVTAAAMIGSLTVLGVHESIYLNVPDWRYDEISVADVIVYSTIFAFISLIAWLSNREIDRSLKRARDSELLLIMERDNLESRVADRTKELMMNQQKRLAEAERSIKIGELAQGLMHDMMNHISAISLYIEEICDHGNDMSEKKKLITKAIGASSRMHRFMGSVRRHIDADADIREDSADVRNEFDVLRDILGHQARINEIDLAIECTEPLTIPCAPLRLHQMLLNATLNAIDACIEKRRSQSMSGHRVENSRVRVSARAYGNRALLSIEDTGCGIAHDAIPALFSKPHTTKAHGTGIGLMTIHAIVVEELQGTIEVKSRIGHGTAFIIDIPRVRQRGSP